MGERVITGEISLIATPPTVKVRSVGPLMVPCPIIIESYLPCAPLSPLISAASLVFCRRRRRGDRPSKFHSLLFGISFSWKTATTFGRQRLTDNGMGEGSSVVSPPAASEGYRDCGHLSRPTYLVYSGSVSTSKTVSGTPAGPAGNSPNLVNISPELSAQSTATTTCTVVVRRRPFPQSLTTTTTTNIHRQ